MNTLIAFPFLRRGWGLPSTLMMGLNATPEHIMDKALAIEDKGFQVSDGSKSSAEVSAKEQRGRRFNPLKTKTAG